jgi:hypothetical protein
MNLHLYMLMVSNARIQLSLHVTFCNWIIIFIFLRVLRREMFLSDIQYGLIYLIELSTGHSDKSGNQRRVTECYTKYKK